MDIIKENREPLDEGDHLPAGALRGEIAFAEVCFEYADGDSPVLHDITFTCLPGQAVALLGSTGSGKTSLVNLLPRFYDYTGGQLLLDGVDLKAYPRRFLRQYIGIVEQEPFLFSRTIRENITYGVGRQVSDEEVEAAARAAAIHDVILSFPEGYQTLVGERGVIRTAAPALRTSMERCGRRLARRWCADTASIATGRPARTRPALDGGRLPQGRGSVYKGPGHPGHLGHLMEPEREVTETIVIVGASHAAVQAIDTLRREGHQGPIVLVGDEPHLPYNRPPLSKKFLSGEMERDRLALRSPEFYAHARVDTRLGARVTAIDRGARRLRLNDGGELTYDKLLLCVGSRPGLLEVLGHDLAGIHCLTARSH